MWIATCRATGPWTWGGTSSNRRRAFLDAVVLAADSLAEERRGEAPDERTVAAARRIAREHAAALPGFDGPEDERLIEYVLETLRAAIAET